MPSATPENLATATAGPEASTGQNPLSLPEALHQGDEAATTAVLKEMISSVDGTAAIETLLLDHEEPLSSKRSCLDALGRLELSLSIALLRSVFDQSEAAAIQELVRKALLQRDSQEDLEILVAELSTERTSGWQASVAKALMRGGTEVSVGAVLDWLRRIEAHRENAHPPNIDLDDIASFALNRGGVRRLGDMLSAGTAGAEFNFAVRALSSLADKDSLFELSGALATEYDPERSERLTQAISGMMNTSLLGCSFTLLKSADTDRVQRALLKGISSTILGDQIDNDTLGEAVSGLVETLASPLLPPLIEAEVSEVLIQIGTPQAVEGVIAAMENAAPDHRRIATNLLVDIRDEQLIPTLEAYAQIAGQDVGEACVKAIAAMGTPTAGMSLLRIARNSTPEQLQTIRKGLWTLMDNGCASSFEEGLAGAATEGEFGLAITALSYIHNEASVRALVNGLHGQRDSARAERVWEVLQCADPQLVLEPAVRLMLDAYEGHSTERITKTVGGALTNPALPKLTADAAARSLAEITFDVRREPWLRDSCAHMLADYGSAEAAAWLVQAADAAPFASSITDAITGLRTEEAVPILRDRMQRGLDSVGVACAVALARTGTGSATEALLDVIDSAHADGTNTNRILREIDSSVTGEAVSALSKRAESSDSSASRRFSLLALARVGTEETTRALVDILGRNIGTAREADCVEALGWIDNPTALPALRNAVSDAKGDQVSTILAKAISVIEIAQAN